MQSAVGTVWAAERALVRDFWGSATGCPVVATRPGPRVGSSGASTSWQTGLERASVLYATFTVSVVECLAEHKAASVDRGARLSLRPACAMASGFICIQIVA